MFYHKFTILLLSFFISFLSSQAQHNIGSSIDFEEIEIIYHTFEDAVKTKNKSQLESIFLHNSVPVSIICNTSQGPHDHYSSYSNWWTNYVSNLDYPHELRISDIKYEQLGEGLIITEARFDEYENNTPSSFGIDVFTYIKTKNGWKLSALHNTVTIVNDSTDYSSPFKFKNNPEEFPVMLREAISNKDKAEFLALFHSPFSPYLGFKSEFNEQFIYPVHSAGGTAERLPRIPASLDVEYGNIKSKIYDNYIAVITMDYKLKVNGKELRNGRQVILLYATAESGWKISGIFQLL